MTLHPLAVRFAEIADVYERGRPDYAPAAIGAACAELGLAPGARVLDLAAGTGKLTRALLAAGLDVIAVEPQEPLREVLAAGVGAERVLEGVAEAIPLADGSVDAVTVADAFHWFDHAPALREIRRVLRPGGGLAVFATAPDWRGASWAEEVGGMLSALRPEHPNFEGPSWQDTVRAREDWSGPQEVHVTTSGPAQPERIVDYVASMSWVAAMDESERAETLARIDGAVRAGETPRELSMHVFIGLAAPR